MRVDLEVLEVVMEPIKPTNETEIWGAVKKNLYWGRRGGTIHKDGTRCFKIKKWKNGIINSGPSGYKLKKAKRGKI